MPVPPSGDLPDPGIELASSASPALAGGFFTTEPPGKPIDNGEIIKSRMTQTDPLPLVTAGYKNILRRQCKKKRKKESLSRDFPGGPVVKTSPSNAEDMGLTPGRRLRFNMPFSQKTKTYNRSNIALNSIKI